MRRKEMTMTTTMTEIREVDRDEIACVEGGGYDVGPFPICPPGWPWPHNGPIPRPSV
jgi:hypothetical protein